MKRNRNITEFDKLVHKKKRLLDSRKSNLDTISEHSKHVSTLREVKTIADNKNKITVVARMSYNNANTMKQKILKDNKGKAGIYR